MEKQHRLELKLGFQIDFSVYGIVACAEVEVLHTWLPSPIRIMICFAAFQVAQDADADASLAPRSGEMAKRTTRSLLL